MCVGVGCEILFAQKMKKLVCHTEKLGSTLQFGRTHTFLGMKMTGPETITD